MSHMYRGNKMPARSRKPLGLSLSRPCPGCLVITFNSTWLIPVKATLPSQSRKLISCTQNESRYVALPREAGLQLGQFLPHPQLVLSFCFTSVKFLTHPPTLSATPGSSAKNCFLFLQTQQPNWPKNPKHLKGYFTQQFGFSHPWDSGIDLEPDKDSVSAEGDTPPIFKESWALDPPLSHWKGKVYFTFSLPPPFRQQLPPPPPSFFT